MALTRSFLRLEASEKYIDSIENLIDARVSNEFDSQFQKLIPRLEPFRKTFFERLVEISPLNCANFGEDITFKNRITHLARCAGPAFSKLVVCVDKWADDVKSLRNDWLHSQEFALRDTAAEAKHEHLIDSARLLMTLCILRLCGVEYPASESGKLVVQPIGRRTRKFFESQYGPLTAPRA